MDLSKLNALKPPRAKAQEQLEHAVNGPDEALVSLAQLYRAYIKGWAHLRISPLLRQRFRSSTVAQETFLRVQGHSGEFDFRTLAEFENYLLKTARAVVVDLTRRHLAQRRSLLREIRLEELESHAFWGAMRRCAAPAPDDVVADRDEQSHRLARVAAALQGIPSHYRQIIGDHFEAGRTIEDIAATLERSPDATRMLLLRALKALRRKLDEEGGMSDE